MDPRIQKQHTGRRLQPKPDERTAFRHLAFIRKLPCCVCLAGPPCEPAHIRKGLPADAKKGGMALRSADKWTVPLCPPTYGRDGHHVKQHAIGEKTFWETLGVGIPVELAKTLWQVSGDLDKGKAKVMEFQRRLVGTGQ